jgi:hypothetical protein
MNPIAIGDPIAIGETVERAFGPPISRFDSAN